MEYMNKFHIEPKEWRDLFDYLKYTDTTSEIDKYIASLSLNKE